MRWSWKREEAVSIMMQVEHEMICYNMGKQKIARANHLYLNCKSVLEFYEYVCASVSYLYDRM